MSKDTATDQPSQRPDTEYVQGKIKLIEQGLPINITESELGILEETLRGARSFYIDILADLEKRSKKGEPNLDGHIVDESRNIAGVELALRQIDEFRAKHWSHIKNSE